MVEKTENIRQYLTIPRAHGPSWSPDGKTLAFLSDQTGLDQVWLLSPSRDKKAVQLTNFPDRVGTVVWSPDGKHLLATVDAGGNEHDQLYLLSTEQGTSPEALTQAPKVIHHFGGWSPDGTALCYSSNQRNAAFFDIWIMDLQTRQSRCLLTQDSSLIAQAWSPDNKYVLVMDMRTDRDEDLLLVAVDGSAVHLLTAHDGDTSYEYPHFSPDSQALYVLTDHQREYLAPARMDLSTLPLTDKHAPLTFLMDNDWDAEAGLDLSPDGKTLAWALNEDGYSRLVFFDTTSSTELPSPALPGGVIEELSWSPVQSQVAFSFNGTAHAGGIWVAQPDAPEAQQLTERLTTLDPETLILPELIHYPSFDGRQIPAYYYRPHADHLKGSTGQLPVIVFVHGGPESQFRPKHMAPSVPPFQYYLQKGFAVLAPNVRGSSGYGKTYVRLDDVELRPDSVADLKAAVDWLIQEGGANPRRIGVMGRSYGGYMVLAAVTTYPDLWAAAVDIVGISNLVSFLEQTGPWRRKWREAEYGSLENDHEVLTRISPIHSVDQITAPLLVLHGANDSRVPVAEAERMVAAVKAQGTPVEYMRFENEGHFMLHQETLLRAYPAIAAWFEKYMGAKKVM